MGSAKAKTLFYMLVVSALLSLVGMAVVRFSASGPAAAGRRESTPDQRLEALEKATSDSPGLHRFLQHERAAQKANQDAADALPR